MFDMPKGLFPSNALKTKDRIWDFAKSVVPKIMGYVPIYSLLSRGFTEYM